VWFGSRKENAKIIEELKSYGIIRQNFDGNGEIILNENFRRNITSAILFPSEPWTNRLLNASNGVLCADGATKIDDESTAKAASVTGSAIIEGTNNLTRSIFMVPDVRLLGHDIDQFTFDRWNIILKYLMNLSTAAENSCLTESIMKILREHLKLIGNYDKRRPQSYGLTALGYEYMLKDYKSQVENIEFVYDFLWLIQYKTNYASVRCVSPSVDMGINLETDRDLP
jgi:hypothetical protein